MSGGSGSASIRSDLVRGLRVDLVGPGCDAGASNERLPIPPSRWYLTGFLVPAGADETQRFDPSLFEAIDAAEGGEAHDEDSDAELVTARKEYLPASMGVSVLVNAKTKHLRVTAMWGDYTRVVPETREGEAGGAEEPYWQRRPGRAESTITIPDEDLKPLHLPLPDSDGLRLTIVARPLSLAGLDDGARAAVPKGARTVSVFLVNTRQPVESEDQKDQAFAFQAQLELTCDDGFVPRPNLRGLLSDDPDERVADLQYRDVMEFAVGHGVAPAWEEDRDGSCRRVVTTWIPEAEVERVEPSMIEGVEIQMEGLAAASDAATLRAMLEVLPVQYDSWIARQRKALPKEERRREVAEELLNIADRARRRIARGIAALEDGDIRYAFQMANRAMAMQARQRAAQQEGKAPAEVSPPRWRIFQLAFLLLNLPGLADPRDSDRETVDLLFFPTGGGKTEAYFGLAAFALILRRLRHPGRSSGGVSVLMRYTLRLLTLDQLGRAAALICALELLREKDPARLGEWPFEIGLWVGRAATPNRMGEKGDNDRMSARAKTIAYKNDSKRPIPIPIETCPWCGTKFTQNSFQLQPNQDHPTDLRIVCMNLKCEFRGSRQLPILAVDDPIYRRLPAFIVATVDKLAGLPWLGPAGALLGRVTHCHEAGFSGPATGGHGTPLPSGDLPGPDLIIQDELHLISGPLGTVAGLYEVAIDALASRQSDSKTMRPKIVASTATVRRAEKQIRALFGRGQVEMFPPASSDRRDSFFAHVVHATEENARLYVGVAAMGRSLKVVMLRSYLALLGAAQKAWLEHGGDKQLPNPADPYMTLVGYFNALRELGGSRRIVEDEVNARLSNYSSRRRLGEETGLFADRQIAHEVLELTSRESTARVAEAKRRLAMPFESKDRVDVALATNMISVGLDILRLGLMVVLGQPKMAAEYIQATSRVGRDPKRPGLVVTLLNIHRPRDRSHYERFGAFHWSFYRAVEPTSVTPFAARAIDRSLPAVVVALARHGNAVLTPPVGAAEIPAQRQHLDFVADMLAKRAAEHDKELSAAEIEELQSKLRALTHDLLDEWAKIAGQKRNNGVFIQYQRELPQHPPLLHEPLDPELDNLPPAEHKFKAHRSMRDVEAAVNLWARRLGGDELPQGGES